MGLGFDSKNQQGKASDRWPCLCRRSGSGLPTPAPGRMTDTRQVIIPKPDGEKVGVDICKVSKGVGFLLMHSSDWGLSTFNLRERESGPLRIPGAMSRADRQGLKLSWVEGGADEHLPLSKPVVSSRPQLRVPPVTLETLTQRRLLQRKCPCSCCPLRTYVDSFDDRLRPQKIRLPGKDRTRSATEEISSTQNRRNHGN